MQRQGRPAASRFPKFVFCQNPLTIRRQFDIV
jgi:hypothetical protein